MHEIHFPMSSLPKISVAEYTTEMAEVYHPDRLLRCHVLLYVTQGLFSIEEDGVEYAVEAGDLFLCMPVCTIKGYTKAAETEGGTTFISFPKSVLRTFIPPRRGLWYENWNME